MLKYVLMVFILSVTQMSAAEDKILYQKGEHIFTHNNALQLIQFAEFLGRSSLSKDDRNRLYQWSIQDFREQPIKGSEFYASLKTTIIPKIRSGNNLDNMRTEIYLNVVNSFKKKPKQAQSPDNFLAIVNRYNPPIQEAQALQLVYQSLILQQMQLNQMLHNQTMNQYQSSMQAITKSMSDHTKRSSIRLSGGKILYETNGRIFAEDSKGNKYDIAK